jgi:hypothetical protein
MGFGHFDGISFFTGGRGRVVAFHFGARVGGRQYFLDRSELRFIRDLAV